MFKKFSVSNFKNFENRIAVDFGKHSNYEFNKDIVKKKLQGISRKDVTKVK